MLGITVSICQKRCFIGPRSDNQTNHEKTRERGIGDGGIRRISERKELLNEGLRVSIYHKHRRDFMRGAAKLRWARGRAAPLFYMLMSLKRLVRAARPRPTSFIILLYSFRYTGYIIEKKSIPFLRKTGGQKRGRNPMPGQYCLFFLVQYVFSHDE